MTETKLRREILGIILQFEWDEVDVRQHALGLIDLITALL